MTSFRCAIVFNFVFTALFSRVHCANILFYHHVASYSHRVVTYPLADALAKRGHEITVISPFHPRGPYINPNITEIVPEKMADVLDEFFLSDFDINFRIRKELPSNVFAWFPTAIRVCQDFLESEELKEYFQKTTKLDLMIVDNCLSECGMAIAYKYGVKHITFSTIAIVAFENDIYGLNPESSAIPELDLYAPQTPMSFFERVKNTLMSLVFRFFHYMQYTGEIDKLVRNRLEDQNMPFVEDLYRNTSLILYMGDLVTDYSRSFPPFVVNVGGIHCKNEKQELPLELKTFVEDDSVEGFVYISLGSLVVSSNLPENIKQVFFQTIESFPKLRFLWKWNGEFPKKIPANLKLGRWFPQSDILAHHKFRAFITQSGRPSTIEAVCAAAPMIAFPVLGDQDVNANRLNEIGGNVKLELGDVTTQELHAALEKAVYDKRMKERMIELQTILNDQPMTPLDTALWWVEYVLRHNDTSHLRAAGFNQWWYQRRLLDVWAFIFSGTLIILIASFGILFFIGKCVFKLLVRKNLDKIKKDRKIK